MFNRALILSASAGSGHIVAARALEAALAQSGGAGQILHVDMLDYTSSFLRFMFSTVYHRMADQAKGFWGWLYGGLYDCFDRPWRFDRFNLATTRFNSRAFIAMVRKFQPDLVIADYPLPAMIVSWMRATGQINPVFGIVVIDFHVHSLWLCRDCDHYFVAAEENCTYLEQLGFDKARISATGNPIHPKFAENKDQRLMRVKYGLREDLTTILVSSGDSGIGPVEHMVRTLMTLRHPAQLVVICGKNNRLRTRLQAVAGELNGSCRVTLGVVGYTTDMDEYMAASDMIVGKAGALTTFESLSKGLAMVIVRPVPGQEERNSDFLLEQGVAVRCNNLSMLAHKIDEILDDPHRLTAMQRRSRQLGRPHAARDIINTLLQLKRGRG